MTFQTRQNLNHLPVRPHFLKFLQPAKTVLQYGDQSCLYDTNMSLWSKLYIQTMTQIVDLESYNVKGLKQRFSSVS